MKFHIGPPVQTLGFPPDASWYPLPCYGPAMFQLMAMPVAMLSAWVMAMVWQHGTTAMDSGILWWNIPLSTFLTFIFAGIPLHELLHALAHPGFGFSSQSYLGFWPSKLLPYAQYTGPISRRRRLVMLLLPFTIMSVLPLGLAVMLRHNAGPFASWFNRHTATLAVYSMLNAMLSGGDFLMALADWRLVPAGAQLQGSGWTLYWKLP